MPMNLFQTPGNNRTFTFQKTCLCEAVSLTGRNKWLIHQIQDRARVVLKEDDPPQCSRCRQVWQKIEAR